VSGFRVCLNFIKHGLEKHPGDAAFQRGVFFFGTGAMLVPDPRLRQVFNSALRNKPYSRFCTGNPSSRAVGISGSNEATSEFEKSLLHSQRSHCAAR
jgi:hypothetical protein